MKFAVRRAGVTLGHGHVVDHERRHGIVVGDRAETLAVGDRGVRRVGEVDEVALVRLVQGVAVDGDGDGLRRFACQEDEGSAGAEVVARRRRGSVRRRVVDRHGPPADRAERDREVGHHGAAVALRDRDVVDRERGLRIVVVDRAQALPVGDRRVDRVGEVQRVRLVRLVEEVTVDEHGHLLRGLPRGEVERPAAGRVIRRRGRRAVQRRIVNRGGAAARGSSA